MNNEEAKIAHSESIERWLMFGGKYLELVVEALEKQVPKKREQRNKMDFCPNCEHWFDEAYDVLFCPDCGQKIDWSDEYDE